MDFEEFMNMLNDEDFMGYLEKAINGELKEEEEKTTGADIAVVAHLDDTTEIVKHFHINNVDNGIECIEVTAEAVTYTEFLIRERGFEESDISYLRDGKPCELSPDVKRAVEMARAVVFEDSNDEEE